MHFDDEEEDDDIDGEPSPLEEDPRQSALVARDAYDEAAFERVCRAQPRLRDLIASGQRLTPQFEALAHDLFSLLFKYHVERRTDVPVSQAFAAHALDRVVTSSGFQRLKAETTLDEVRAGFACTRLTERVLGLLRNPELFDSHELMDAFRAEQLERELERARQRLDTIQELDQARRQQQPQQPQDADSDPGDGEDEPDGAAAAGGVLGDVARAVREEVGALERALQALARAQAQRLERLPVSAESQLREAVAAMPERMQADDAAAEQFTQAIGGAGESIAADARLELGERLLDSEKLQRLARLAGAFRQVALGARRRRFERRPAELHAIERAGTLARVLPSELVGLRHPLLRKDFLRRMVESQLLSYAVEGRDRAGRGPLVVCLDGSGSMQGPRELWAKAVSLTLLELCRRQRRAFHAMVFSGGRQATRSFQLTREAAARSVSAPVIDYAALVDFAEYFPRGGTRFEDPLERAVAILEHESRFKRGDIVLVTDGEAHLPEAWLAWFTERKASLEFKLHAVLVDVGGPGRRSTLERIADTVTAITELTAEAALDLYAAI